MALPEREDDPGIVDHRLDLEAVSDDPGVREEALLLSRAVAGDGFRIEALERRMKVRALAEDRGPREAGLVDLEREALEELRVSPERKTVFAVVIGPVQGVTGRNVAIGHEAGILTRLAAFAKTPEEGPVDSL